MTKCKKKLKENCKHKKRNCNDTQVYKNILCKKMELLESICEAYELVLCLIQQYINDVACYRDVINSAESYKKAQSVLVVLTKNLLTSISVALMETYCRKPMFILIPCDSTKNKGGYYIKIILPGNTFETCLYCVDSYKLCYCNSGIAIIKSYDCKCKKTEILVGAKWNDATDKCELGDLMYLAMKNNDKLLRFFQMKYTESASAFNNLNILVRKLC